MALWTRIGVGLLLSAAGAPAAGTFVGLPGLPGVAIAVHETTVGEFRRFVAATGHDATGGMVTLGADDFDWLPRGHTWADPGFVQTDAHPVVGVNLADARAYAAWLTAEDRAAGRIAANEGYRLPTDREWSLAAGLRNEDGATPEERMAAADSGYPWGRDWPPPAGFGNYAGTESAAGKPSWWGTIPGGYSDDFPRTSPVGRFPANAQGLHDLSGNVWEWVDEAYTTSSIARVARGGCWGSDRPAYLLLAKRSPQFVGSRNDELGFRLVRVNMPAAVAGSAVETSKAPAAAIVPVRVELDWIANVQFAGLILAHERGWYREAGLEVTLSGVNLQTMETVGPVVAAPGVVIGVADGSALLRARAAGAPVQAFATIFQASPIGVVTLASRGFTGLAELKGKRIGLHAYNRPQLAKMLANAGLTLEDVTPVVLGNDHTSLPLGKVDAQVAYVIDEKVAFETDGHAVKAFFGYEHGYRAYSQVYFTTEKTRAGEAAVLTRFLEASNRGWRAATADPAAAAALIVAKYQPTLSAAYQEGSLRLIGGLLEVESGGGSMGRMRRETWLNTPDATPELVDALFAPLSR